jgi:hypothetical protein
MPTNTAFSFATLKGQERQNQIELAAEGLESRLESLRARGRRIKKPLPDIVVAKDILSRLYSDKTKKAGNEVLYSLETIQEMSYLQLLIALNTATVNSTRGYADLTSKLGEFKIPTSQEITPADSNLLTKNLKELVQFVNKNEPNIEIPFASASAKITNKQIADILLAIRSDAQLKTRIATAHKAFVLLISAMSSIVMTKAQQQETEMRREEGEFAVTRLQAIARGRKVRSAKAAAEAPEAAPAIPALPADLETKSRNEIIALMAVRGLTPAKGERITKLIARLKAYDDI